jgi:ferredoxin
MPLWDDFVALFGVWEEARPYLSLIVDEQEMALIVVMQGQPLTVEQVADRLGLQHDAAASFLERCYARCIVDRPLKAGGIPIPVYSPGDFYGRLDHFAKFENWDDIPAVARSTIDRRFLREFIAKHRPTVERKMQHLEADNALPNDTILLLSEVEEMIGAATDIVVQPCDCRRLAQNCDRPVETCIWLDEGARKSLDRGFGRPLTREEAVELVRWADRKGLMHTGDSEWRARGLHAICNCCACDCYPFRAAQELGSKGVWPRSRYIAAYDAERCNRCGACVKRCHFAAFYHPQVTGHPDATGSLATPATGERGDTVKQEVRFDPERCWGCGLCANGCPSGAIVMEMLP